MSEFSDRPFVAGSLVGLRSFDVDSLGRLTGVTFQTVFTPDENTAQCGGGDPVQRQIVQVQNQINAMVFRYHTGAGTPRASRPHVTAGLGCRCGFYAFFDGRNDYARDGRVTGIIEGYGVCTVGSRGFRAEKARLLAIVDPAADRGWTGWWKSWKLNAAAATWLTAAMAGELVDHDWLWAAFDACVAVINIAISVRVRRTEKKAREDLAAVRRNYPDVPRYRTQKAALKAHPLTPPDPITPATTDDFWTRSESDG